MGSRPLRRFPSEGSRAFFHLLLLVDMVVVWQPVPKSKWIWCGGFDEKVIRKWKESSMHSRSKN